MNEYQQVEITMKLNLWLDASMHEEQIGEYVRNSIYRGFPDQLGSVEENSLIDVLDIKQEAEIYETESSSGQTDPQIIVNVYGGLVQGIGASRKVEVVVVDWDTEATDYDSVVQITDALGLPASAYVYSMPTTPLSELAKSDVDQALQKAGMSSVCKT